jgi:hypothetical protein
MALTHFQQDPIRVTRAQAALWIAVNVMKQSRDMENLRWLFTHSRRLDMFEASLANDYWRCDGCQGGIWFYPRESFRDESPRGRWVVIATIPEPFAYHFTAMNHAAVSILPGPIPPHRIVKQGPADSVFRELERDHGGIEAYLRALES